MEYSGGRTATHRGWLAGWLAGVAADSERSDAGGKGERQDTCIRRRSLASIASRWTRQLCRQLEDACTEIGRRAGRQTRQQAGNNAICLSVYSVCTRAWCCWRACSCSALQRLLRRDDHATTRHAREPAASPHPLGACPTTRRPKKEKGCAEMRLQGGLPCVRLCVCGHLVGPVRRREEMILRVLQVTKAVSPTSYITYGYGVHATTSTFRTELARSLAAHLPVISHIFRCSHLHTARLLGCESPQHRRTSWKRQENKTAPWLRCRWEAIIHLAASVLVGDRKCGLTSLEGISQGMM